MNSESLSNDERGEKRQRRWFELFAIVVMCSAVTGYFVGIAAPSKLTKADGNLAGVTVPHHQTDNDPKAEPVHDVLPATGYSDMANADFGARTWNASLATLKQTPYDLRQEIKVDPNDKKVSLDARAELRAYNGAPPTIPHAINQMSTESCMSCHGEGLKSESLRASRMPHPFYTNCTQCHVEQKNSTELFRETTFAGLQAPDRGDRAYSLAPPTIPHSTWMRSECLSCHGRTANAGMETTHPWRQSCTQCHAPSAQLDQNQTFGTAPLAHSLFKAKTND